MVSRLRLFAEREQYVVHLRGGLWVDVLARWSRAALIVSLLMFAIAPRFVPETYSIVENTLSESGAQGTQGAWVFRAGVLLAACSVSLMAVSTRQGWSPAARRWMRFYGLALVMLMVFPEAPPDGGAYDETTATLHTAFAASGGASFILGVIAVSLSRARHDFWFRSLDWVVVAAVVVIPQVMLVTGVDGLLQRIMVGLGYIWLLSEAGRAAKPERSAL